MSVRRPGVGRAGAGLFLLLLTLTAFVATWLAAAGEFPCGWGIFYPP